MNFYFDPFSGTELGAPVMPGAWLNTNGGLTWFFNPWTGAERPAESIADDPRGEKFITHNRPLNPARVYARGS